jgi:tetratricopeptide (TPR) repeat protein/DNA-binding winged helix-turn-helix (wHTH) protein
VRVVVRETLLQGFWLGELRIEPLTGTVSGANGASHLPSRAVEVLLCLARQPGELVSREELLAEVWGTDSASPEALSHAVSELRHGLGDHAVEPVFIQTVPRRGYRLLLEPRQDDALPESPPSAPVPRFWKQLMQRGVVHAGVLHLVAGWLLIQVAGATFNDLGMPDWAARFVTYVVVAGFPLVLVLAWFLEFTEGRMTLDRGSRARRNRGGLERNYLAVVLAYGVATIGIGVYQASVGIGVAAPAPPQEITETLPAVDQNSIAVLRFRTFDEQPMAQLFGDGLAEDVLDRLARVPGLAVASRTDAWSLPADADSGVVRRRLRVASYLEGSIRLDDGNLRVTVQLIDSATGFHRFSRTFTRELKNFIEVQKEVTDLTVANLRIALEADTESWLAESYVATDLDAYVLYRQGREIFDAPLTTESLEEARALFTESLRLDPGYAAAHAGLCSSYVQGYLHTGETELIAQAENSCARALISNPNLYMVLTALGDLYQATNRLEQAELAYRSALERNPQDVLAMSGLADTFQRQNRLDEAELQLQRAIAVQPGNWRTINAMGAFFFGRGRYAEAAAAFRDVVVLDAYNWQAQGNLGSALLMSGRFNDAAAALERALEINPDQGSYSNLGIVYYYLGKFDESAASHRLAIEHTPRSQIGWLNLADALYFAGDSEAATAAFLRTAELCEERLAINAGDTESLEALAFATAMLGKHARARELMERALQLAPNDPYPYYYDALVRQQAGDTQGALDAIEAAVERGYSKIMLQAEPYLADLQHQQRFAAMLVRDDGE